MPDRKPVFWHKGNMPSNPKLEQLTEKQRSMFTVSSKGAFTGGNGVTKDAYRPMTIGNRMVLSEKTIKHGSSSTFTKLEKAGEYQSKLGWIKGDSFYKERGKLYNTTNMPRSFNRASVKSMRGSMFDAVLGRSTVKLPNFQWMIYTLQFARARLPITANNWKVVVAKRAEKVFKDSFKLKRFNSHGEKQWKANTSWTVKKRKWRGHWPQANKLMQETNELYESLKFFQSKSSFGPAGVHVSRRGAAVHNDPEPGDTYGRGFGTHSAKPVTRRQFMGHSTEIERFEHAYIDKYFFYDIWRAPMGAPIRSVDGQFY